MRALENLKRQYDTPQALLLDPLTVVMEFPDPWDREVAAFLAASLAYGRVAPMVRAIRTALAPLGTRPAQWLRNHGPDDSRSILEYSLKDWKWRFHQGAEVAHWLGAWARWDLESEGKGLEPHLLPGPGESPDEALSKAILRLRRALPATTGLRFSLPDPATGSACKRWRMFLRWMVRSEWPDLGQWKQYPAATLIIPVDTHVARISRYLGLTSRTTPDGRMAEEITASLRKADPLDPLKYDFALSHLGILGDCPGVRALPGCSPCPLVKHCRAGKL